MDLEKEWALQTEEKFWRAEEQKEEIDYQLRSQRCDLFFSLLIRKRTMKNYHSLRNNREFQMVYNEGNSKANRYLVLYYRKNDLEYNRLGISVSKKVGNSVVRHRTTRLIRESYRLNQDNLKTGYLHLIDLHHLKKSWLQLKKILISIIRFYRKYLSRLKGRGTCIYVPTCSEYAIEALEKHGVVKGSLLAIFRILRCNPFSKGGYDPVPEVRKGKRCKKWCYWHKPSRARVTEES